MVSMIAKLLNQRLAISCLWYLNHRPTVCLFQHLFVKPRARHGRQKKCGGTSDYISSKHWIFYNRRWSILFLHNHINVVLVHTPTKWKTKRSLKQFVFFNWCVPALLKQDILGLGVFAVPKIDEGLTPKDTACFTNMCHITWCKPIECATCQCHEHLNLSQMVQTKQLTIHTYVYTIVSKCIYRVVPLFHVTFDNACLPNTCNAIWSRSHRFSRSHICSDAVLWESCFPHYI